MASASAGCLGFVLGALVGAALAPDRPGRALPRGEARDAAVTSVKLAAIMDRSPTHTKYDNV